LTDVGRALWDLKAGFGSVWVADRTAKHVLRGDPATATITARIEVGPKASGRAVLADGERRRQIFLDRAPATEPPSPFAVPLVVPPDSSAAISSSTSSGSISTVCSTGFVAVNFP